MATKCKHQFQGHKDGVTCMKCGLKMTPAQYQAFLNPTKDESSEKQDEQKEGAKNG